MFFDTQKLSQSVRDGPLAEVHQDQCTSYIALMTSKDFFKANYFRVSETSRQMRIPHDTTGIQPGGRPQGQPRMPATSSRLSATTSQSCSACRSLVWRGP